MLTHGPFTVCTNIFCFRLHIQTNGDNGVHEKTIVDDVVSKHVIFVNSKRFPAVVYCRIKLFCDLRSLCVTLLKLIIDLTSDALA